MALSLTPRQLNQRSEFYYQLAQLTGAGLGLINILEMLSRKPPARSYRRPLQQIVADMSKGATFSDAISRLGSWTPSFDIALIGAGEKSGRLDAVFKLLGDHYSDRAKLLMQMISDLLYPVFVFHMAVFLFPFIEFFRDGNVVKFGLKTIGVLIPAYALVLGAVYAGQGRHGVKWRSFLERLLRPVPVLGTARHYLALARVSAALDALLNAGITIVEAWEMAAAASGSPAMLRAVQAWKPQVTSGVTPSEVVSASREFPELFANLYRSGELSGKLDESLQRLHKYYQEEAVRKLRTLARILPRLFYFGVAILVGYKVVHFYLDYFNQLNQIMGP